MPFIALIGSGFGIFVIGFVAGAATLILSIEKGGVLMRTKDYEELRHASILRRRAIRFNPFTGAPIH